MLNREGLDVLVHPLTDNSYDDHSRYAVWFGTPVGIEAQHDAPHLPPRAVPHTALSCSLHLSLPRVVSARACWPSLPVSPANGKYSWSIWSLRELSQIARSCFKYSIVNGRICRFLEQSYHNAHL